MSSAVANYLHALCVRLKNVPHKKVVQNSLPGPISMIQVHVHNDMRTLMYITIRATELFLAAIVMQMFQPSMTTTEI